MVVLAFMTTMTRHIVSGLLLALPIVIAPSCAFDKLSVETCGGFVEDSAGCDGCMQTNCCAEAEACRESSACAALYDCLAPCNDDAACRQACGKAHPSDAAAATLQGCRLELCVGDCSSCAGIWHLTSTACDDCMRTQCCAPMLDCHADEACGDLVTCHNDCRHPTCWLACQSELPAGGEPSESFFQCIAGSCSAECKIGREFSCVDNFQYPSPEGSTVIFTGEYNAGGNPVAGLTVRACPRADADCSDVIAEAVTGSDGRVELTLPAGGDGFIGYFEVTGNAVLVPLMQSQSRPMFIDEFRGFNMTALADAMTLYALIGKTFDNSLGTIFAFPTDCNDYWARDVTLELTGPDTEGSLRFYLSNGIPDINATKTTDFGGGFLDVKPGLYTVSAIDPESGVLLDEVDMLVRAGFITSTTMSPSP
jgi:hypothetical protein